jgi:hypothetical protein
MRAIRETRTNRTRCSLMHGVRRIWASQTRYRSRRTGMMHGTREGGWIMFSHSSDPSGEKKYSLGPGAVLGEVRDEGGRLDHVWSFFHSDKEDKDLLRLAPSGT